MKDKTICEKCSHEMIRNSTIGMICPNCGWGWASTYIEPIFTDNTDYHIIIETNEADILVIKTISKIANINFLQAKKLIKSAPVKIFTGQACEVKRVKKILEDAMIPFSIKPEFRY